MARDNDVQLFVARHNSAGGDLDTDRKSFFNTRPILIKAVTFVGENPSDTDTDTTAIDVSASTDGFSSDDNEIAALAAQEYNDTDVHAQFGTDRQGQDIPLTTTSLATGTEGVRVAAGSVVEVTMTNVGAGADTRYNVIVEYVVL